VVVAVERDDDVLVVAAERGDDASAVVAGYVCAYCREPGNYCRDARNYHDAYPSYTYGHGLFYNLSSCRIFAHDDHGHAPCACQQKPRHCRPT